ncbi:MAG: hypothetical protein U1E26_00795 [Coriobacteriia bacterium]|nr:hypothetical protein [Coriobacteriia bacterium]
MPGIDELIVRMRELQDELQVEFDKRRDGFQFVVEQKRIRFAEDVVALQRGAKTGLFTYMFGASLRVWLTVPVIYAGAIPLLLLDLFIWIYQSLCFPVYRIPKVKRSEYLVLDRGDLEYLNAAQKLGCFYCGYANGLASYFREVAARTEQYWCPIKHSRRILAAHDHYPNFFEFGDAESYRLGLERLRAQLAEQGLDT